MYALCRRESGLSSHEDERKDGVGLHLNLEIRRGHCSRSRCCHKRLFGYNSRLIYSWGAGVDLKKPGLRCAGPPWIKGPWWSLRGCHSCSQWPVLVEDSVEARIVTNRDTGRGAWRVLNPCHGQSKASNEWFWLEASQHRRTRPFPSSFSSQLYPCFPFSCRLPIIASLQADDHKLSTNSPTLHT